MKHLLIILLSIFIFSCSNKINYELKPSTPKSEAQVHAEIVINNLMDDNQIKIIGVNYLYYFGYSIYALHKHGMLTKELINRLLDILPTFYTSDLTGLTSFPHGYDNNRTATRDDYLGLLLGLHTIYIHYSEPRAKEHLDFFADVMNDSSDPYIPEELRKENEHNQEISVFGFSDWFVGNLIKFYQKTIIKGLPLTNDVWSPYHRNCFRRSVGNHSGDQSFWDMANYYASIQPSVKKGYDETFDKLLSMCCLIIARETNRTYWSNESDNYLHDKIDMQKVTNIYYSNNPNQFLKSLGILLLGNT